MGRAGGGPSAKDMSRSTTMCCYTRTGRERLMSFAENPPPEADGPTFTLSNWGKRVLATLIDAILGYVIVGVGLALNGGDRGAIYQLFSLFAFAFGIWQLVRQGQKGQTIGKQAIKIKVVKEATAE